jgi:hypothetical protein
MQPIRAYIGYLIGTWNLVVPLTRSFVVGNLYTITQEHPGIFDLEWNVLDVFYPDNSEVVKALDELGCLNSFLRAFTNEAMIRNQVLASLTEPQKNAIDEFWATAQCAKFEDSLRLKGRTNKLMQQQRTGANK